MQTQDGPVDFFFKLWPKLEQNKNALMGGAAAILLVSFVGYYVSAQHAQKEVDAGEALTTLLMSPTVASSPSQAATSLEVIAAKYSNTAAGERAQLQAAAALFEAGNYPEAQAQFQKYLDANASGTLAATAQLGLASSCEAQNKTDLAMTAYARVSNAYSSSAAVGPAEYALGRLYEQQSKLPEAMSHYQNVLRATLNQTTLHNEAMARAYELQRKLAATTSKTVTPKAATPAMGTNALPAVKF